MARYKTPDVKWSETSTLAETVYKLVKEKKTDSDEFKKLLEFFGREKLGALYKQEKRRLEDVST